MLTMNASTLTTWAKSLQLLKQRVCFFNFTANPGERLSFFYKYYDVIVSKILNDYYDEIKNK